MATAESGCVIDPIAPPPARQREDRIHALDSLRAVAMFLGIVLHGACSFMSTGHVTPWPVRDLNTHFSFDVAVFLIHGFRMHLFFLLGGFFGRLSYERLGAVPFVKQRLTRIGLPLLAGPVLLVLPFLFVAIWSFSWLTNPGRMDLKPPPGAVGPPTGHLWFLQFLLILYSAAMGARWLAAKLPAAAFAGIDRVFQSLMKSPARVVVFVPLTVICLWNGPVWGEPHYAGAGVLPTGRAVAHYGLFFFVGWWLHRHRSLLEELKRFIVPSLVIGIGAMMLHGFLLRSQPVESATNYLTLKTASLAGAGIYAWAMSLALTGIFLRFATESRPWVRYLADASYWCYLAHPALVLFLQVLLAEWRVPAGFKFSLLLVATMAVLLLSYQFCVRYTWIGTILNGRRERPSPRSGSVAGAWG